jgi:hypothetical protein
MRLLNQLKNNKYYTITNFLIWRQYKKCNIQNIGRRFINTLHIRRCLCNQRIFIMFMDVGSVARDDLSEFGKRKIDRIDVI